MGTGMLDAGTGLPIGTLVGAAEVGVGVAAAVTCVGLPVGGGSSLQADSNAATARKSSPARASRRWPSRKSNLTMEMGANLVVLFSEP